MLVRSVTRWAPLAIWAAVAASALAWGLRLFAPGAPVPAHAMAVADSQTLRGDPGVVLGRAPAVVIAAPQAPAVAPSRFKLIGVLAPRAPRAAGEGLALIAIDGKPPRAYRVGSTVEGDLVLQRVYASGVDLGPRGSAQGRVSLAAPPLVPGAAGANGGNGAQVQNSPSFGTMMADPRYSATLRHSSQRRQPTQPDPASQSESASESEPPPPPGALSQ